MKAARAFLPRVGLRAVIVAVGSISGASVGAATPGAEATPEPRTAEAVAVAVAGGSWDFEVRLDGKPIGSHRFEVAGEPDARTVRSVARFDVKLLGLTVFRYRHEARERWRGDCLQELQSRTDDDGKPIDVDKSFGPRVPSTASPAPSTLTSPSAPPAASGSTSPAASTAGTGWSDCLMSYAYWHPALVRQQRLLNPQTGEVDEVRIERLPDASITVAGREVEAMRWRLTATPPVVAGKPAERQQLTLWRARSDGRWVGLDAVVKGGRMLTYRLR